MDHTPLLQSILTPNLQLPTSNSQPPTPNLQLPTSNSQLPTPNSQNQRVASTSVRTRPSTPGRSTPSIRAAVGARSTVLTESSATPGLIPRPEAMKSARRSGSALM